MPKTNLSLGNLYRAISGSARTSQVVSLSGLNGGGSSISFSAFAIDSVTVTPPTFTYIVEDTSENATFTFTSPGTRHGVKVGIVSNNYTCSFDNSNFTVPSSSLGASPSFNIKAAAQQPAPYTGSSAVLTMAYADGYNINATNYGESGKQTKTLYAVDVYNTINEPDFCLLFGTQIQLQDGSEMNVEDLRVGDVIKAWVPSGLPDEDLPINTDSVDWRMYLLENLEGQEQNVAIENITFDFADSYYSLNGGLIKATALHPLYVWDSQISKYRFKNVCDIIIGDKLIKYDIIDQLEEIDIVDIELVFDDVEIVTLNVETADVYMSNGFISHNKGTTSQPNIPYPGLRMYLDPSKAASFPSGLPSTGTPTVDWLDIAGWNTGVRPGGQGGLGQGSPTYNNGGVTRKDYYYALNGTNQIFYKDTTSNINGGYSEFNITAGTIHMWVRPTTTLGTSTRRLFDYNGNYGFAIESSDNSTLNRLKFYSSTLGDSAQVTTSLSSNVWYLISVSFGSAVAPQFYVDGVSVGTLTASATISAPTSTNYIVIGGNDAFSSFWNGQIGPVLFYNRRQNSTEVDQVYDYFSPTYKV